MEQIIVKKHRATFQKMELRKVVISKRLDKAARKKWAHNNGDVWLLAVKFKTTGYDDKPYVIKQLIRAPGSLKEAELEGYVKAKLRLFEKAEQNKEVQRLRELIVPVDEYLEK